MKWMILLTMFFVVGAQAQTTQCVEVPENHKIVFIPWIIPTDELTWKWHHAKDVEEAEPDVFEPEYCDGEGKLVVSPSFCIPRPE